MLGLFLFIFIFCRRPPFNAIIIYKLLIMKILILTNNENKLTEDNEIADSLRADGHKVSLRWVDSATALNNYDLIIRRNCWTEDLDKIEYYKDNLRRILKKAKDLNIPNINLFESSISNKSALVDLYKNYNGLIIPTYRPSEVDKIHPKSKKYIIKEIDSMGSGIGQFVLDKSELENLSLSDDVHIIQPLFNFIAEVQVYFVGQDLMYAYEYTPSKYPLYPKPKKINLNNTERNLSQMLAALSGLQAGFMRIDFLRMADGSLKFMELEDTSPHMNFAELDDNTKSKTIDKYKTGIYNYIDQIAS